MLNGGHDLGMKGSTLLASQRAVGSLLGQGVPEGELDVREQATLEDEVGGLQLGENVLELVLGRSATA
jgi:hypothetical protein